MLVSCINGHQHTDQGTKGPKLMFLHMHLQLVDCLTNTDYTLIFCQKPVIYLLLKEFLIIYKQLTVKLSPEKKHLIYPLILRQTGLLHSPGQNPNKHFPGKTDPLPS